MRRNALQLRVAAQRIAIGDAWTGFEQAAARGEAKVRRVVTWMRRVSALSALLAMGMAARRLFHGGFASRALGALALAQGARRLLIPLRRRYARQNAQSSIHESR
jgi:hypothetical protein